MTLSASFLVRKLFSAKQLMHYTSLCVCGLPWAHTSLIFFIPGIPDDVIAKGRDYKMVTEITQDGNTFSWTQLYPANAKVANTFSVDKEADMETIGGKKFKVGGKDSGALEFRNPSLAPVVVKMEAWMYPGSLTDYNLCVFRLQCTWMEAS